MSNKKLEPQKPNKLTPVKALAYVFILTSSFFFIWDATLWLIHSDSWDGIGAMALAYLSAIPAVALFLVIVGYSLLKKRPQDRWFLGTFAIYVLIFIIDWTAMVQSGV